jgi:hypothetical protein
MLFFNGEITLFSGEIILFSGEIILFSGEMILFTGEIMCFRGTHGYTGVHGIQRNTWGYFEVKVGPTGVHGGTQGYTRV